jgi:hypothetical protein
MSLYSIPESLVPYYLQLESATLLLCDAPEDCKYKYLDLVNDALLKLNKAKYNYKAQFDVNSEVDEVCENDN